MPKDKSIRKVLVIGSGPIVIGQAAEFDYAGAQACRVLREEGVNVVLVNSNPATIMTDRHLADEIYLEPLNPETVARILEKERPDGLLAGLGGQTGLTIAMQLSRDGTLERCGVRLLGSDMQAIETAEDRELFRNAMRRIGQKGVPSDVENRAGNRRSHRLSGDRAPGVHPGRRRRRHCGRSGPAAGNRRQWAGAFPHYPGTGGKMHRGMEGNRI